MKKDLNQKLINLIEYYNLINANILFSEKPLKRIKRSFSFKIGRILFKIRKKTKKLK